MIMCDRLLGKKRYAAYKDPLVIILIILIFLLLCRVLFSFRYQGIYVVGNSMLPTLVGAETSDTPGGDYLYADTYAMPEHGDIVVLDTPGRNGRYIIKRVIALSGDTIYLDRGIVYVMYNGTDEFVALNEEYVLEENFSPWEPINSVPSKDEPVTVPENSMFVLGDNRNVSHDSRAEEYGCFSYSQLVGVITDWSLNCKEFFTGLYTFFAFGF